MSSRRKFRSIKRLIQFGWISASAMADYWMRFAFRKHKATPPARALWLQRHSRRTLKMFSVTPKVYGTVPTRGLLISNHLSYLDVMVISSVTSAVFVAKKEIRTWPIMGICARMGGTLFIDRERKMHVGEMTDEIQNSLDSGTVVVLFPEGTSTDGKDVLPFRSALLQPAARRTQPLSVACLEYILKEGDASDEVCYWGDHEFFPHMMNLLGRESFQASVHFSPFDPGTSDRKELAPKLRAEVLKLKDELAVAK